MKNLRAALKPDGLRPDWTSISFLAFTTIGAVVSVIAYVTGHVQFSWPTYYMAHAIFILSGFAITAGYHRGFTHRSHRSHVLVRLYHLILGSAAFLGPVLSWTHKHRLHHAKTDQQADPNNAKVGFWWAHFISILYTADAYEDFSRAHDLKRDPLVVWQQRFYVPISAVVAVAIPCYIGSLWGDALGALMMAFFIRVFVEHQMVFCVNSVAHKFGSAKWSSAISARDNWLLSWVATAGLVASLVLMLAGHFTLGLNCLLVFLEIVTLGEILGHGWHHHFEKDYRNGPNWWDLDPTRWLIRALASVGLVSNLHRTPVEQVNRAKLAALTKT